MIFEDGDVGKVHDREIDSIPLIQDVNRPYRVSPYLPLPSDDYVLAKTHCGGYCFLDYPPNWYRLSPLKFLQVPRMVYYAMVK